MSPTLSRDGQLREFMQMYELKEACDVCTVKRSRVAYSIIAIPHNCTQSLLLVRAKVKGPKDQWRHVMHPSCVPEPRRYKVCWYSREDVGCYVHQKRCFFASSEEEAAVWNLLKDTKLDRKSLLSLITQQELLIQQGQEHSPPSSNQQASYQEKLLEEYRKSNNEILIISEQVDDVCVSHDKNLHLDCLQTDSEIKWKFKISTERTLAHVALLKVESGAVFSLGDTSPAITHAAGHHLQSSESTYELSVCFLSFRPGVYEQWLVFDFDIRPVLLRKLKVRVGELFHTSSDMVQETGCAEMFSGERWNRGNRVIVPYCKKKEEDEQLLNKYKQPEININFSPHLDLSSPLHKDNYRERAHYFLFTEEMAQQKLISRLNLCGSVYFSNQLDDITSPVSKSGGLFGTLKVSCSLTTDSAEGQMLKRSNEMALVALKTQSKHMDKVYEALVVKPVSEDHIGLNLSAICVSELQLRNESKCEMEIQFQLDRLSFCKMHQAIDLLPDLHNVLPDLSNCSLPVSKNTQSWLNNKQQIALNFILGKCEGRGSPPPLLIYGPFGTGKTFCLAKTAIQLTHEPKTRVLICTYTNSSADLYVTKHFHRHITATHSKLRVLRIKANKGFVATDVTTRKYCLCSPDRQSFISPKRSDLESHQIIITTVTMARNFSQLNLPEGFFSHLLIDEASQMLECDALIALSLADKHTRVVLAGDHMQMAPTLFSVTDDKRSEHTLLNRLFHYYQDRICTTANKSRVILNENYRSTAEIVNFVSTHFYGGDGIKAKGNVPPHPKLYPLRFLDVRGECFLDCTSMSWYNTAEVKSVIKTVEDLLSDWPTEWGRMDIKDICILTEGQQREVIKDCLRRSRAHGVSVQNLANIQGKEFRVIIITTVQTREKLLETESSCPVFFEDIRALNTALTRAQSLVIAVGDAAALCCFGKCSKVWRSYIEHCISKGSAEPDQLTTDYLQHEVLELSKFQRTKMENRTEMIVPVNAETDRILQEMHDYEDLQDSDEEIECYEEKRILFSAVEKENLLELVRKHPAIYSHGELIMEKYQSGYVIPYNNPNKRIRIKGRQKIGMTFPGDEVVVETDVSQGPLTGKILGVTNRPPTSSQFVCTLENPTFKERAKRTNTDYITKTMVPLKQNTTKIRILIQKSSCKFIPLWHLVNGRWRINRYIDIDEQTKQDHVYVVDILGWKPHCSFPLGNVTDVLPVGTTLEAGLRILKSEFELQSPPLMHSDEFTDTKMAEVIDKKRIDLTELQTFTIDPPNARILDDAISVQNLGCHYEIGIHIADVAYFVSKDSSLDKFAKNMGATFYNPGQEPEHMFPKRLMTDHCSLLPDKVRKVISLIIKVEKLTGNISQKTIQLSTVKSKRQFSYDEAEGMISHIGGDLKFDTIEDCVRVAHQFARAQRKARLKEALFFAKPRKNAILGEREANLMIEELNIIFNHEVSKFLTEETQTKLCTPLRCQQPPTAESLEVEEEHKKLLPLSSHLMFHIDRLREDLTNTSTVTICSSDELQDNLNPDQNTRLLDAISISQLEYCLEIGIHKADYLNYDIPTTGPLSKMWNLRPGKKCRAISLILEVAPMTRKVVGQRFVLSFIKSSAVLSSTEVDNIINQPDGSEHPPNSVERCLIEAFQLALDHRNQRVSENRIKMNSMLMMAELKLMFKESSENPTCEKNSCPKLLSRLQNHRDIPLVNLVPNSEDKENNFMIMTHYWEKIKSAAENDEFYKMSDYISTDDIHPQLISLNGKMKSLQRKAYFIRSQSCEEALCGHYSLNLESYTHTSSPMRRYIDVVLQRLVHAVLIDLPVDYSETEIDLLCNKCEKGQAKAQQYERKAESLSLAVSLQKQAVYKVAFVSFVNIESKFFKLSFPLNKGTHPDSLCVLYRNLQLNDQPMFKNHHVKLSWKKRIYALNMNKIMQRKFKLCSEIEMSAWHAIIEAVRDEEWEEAKKLVLEADVKEHYNTDEDIKPTQDSDCTHLSEEQHYTTFNLSLEVGSTVHVQLSSERSNIYWEPIVQLLRVTPRIEICVEHTHNPTRCFSKSAYSRPMDFYKGVDEYVQIWKPLCEIESAVTAVEDSESIVIENIKINWNLSKDGGNISLPEESIKSWAIEFDLSKCFLCFRSLKQLPEDKREPNLDPDYFTLVVHGETTHCLDSPEYAAIKSKSIYFKVTSECISRITKLTGNSNFTVEVIPKALPEIRKESAVNNLIRANELVTNIALGQKIPKESFEPVLRRHRIRNELPPAGLPQLNESQLTALEKALSEKFTIIQGPPGTGKSVVGAYIVYWFSKMNTENPWRTKELQDREKKEVILYCGPSNKSVDVVGEYLIRFGEKLKPLRIYSRQMEMVEYPYPGSVLQLSQKSLRQERSKSELRNITLHHRIRQNQNPHHQKILDFDEKIRLKCSMADEDVEEYKQLLSAARVYELKRHDIILCTCTAAASPSLTKTLTARQILIDECAMATEPQTLVPLVSFKPQKIVLLGDHKQLRPIVKNEKAKKLGMTRSLFERCISRALLLDTQYRMHEDICKFPSEAYYKGKLKTEVVGRASKLHFETANMRQSKHILFGDIVGHETSLVVSTERGNENSKANYEEANKATEICGRLVLVGRVKPEHIAILSPYNAQAYQIRKNLNERHSDIASKVTVTTITKSQGSEWRYVILSMVRSCPWKEIEKPPSWQWVSKHIGFISDENQINVGITRAQDGLCILGNQELLNCSPAWKKLLTYYSSKGCMVSADQITVHNI